MLYVALEIDAVAGVGAGMVAEIVQRHKLSPGQTCWRTRPNTTMVPPPRRRA
jgi:hypothetical protein